MTGPNPPSRTTVHLVRHGEVDNPGRVLYGRLPGFTLSERGHDMARRAAAYLSGRDVTQVVSSPLERAQQTAEPIAAAYGLEVQIDDDALEARNAFEGRAVAGGAGILRDPRMWPLLLNPLRPSWGEPYLELVARMHAAVDRAREAARGHEAVIVSHQAPIWLLRLALQGRRLAHDPRRRECSLASVTSLTYAGDQLLSLAYAEPVGDLQAQARRGSGA